MRRNTFSTSTIESSTSEPMAIARPPRLMVLSVNPISFMLMMAISIETGIETSEITAVLQFIRKMNSTTITKKAPSSSDLPTFPTEFRMKSDCLNMSVLMFIPAGRLERISSSASSISRVSLMVFTSGCLVTVSSTASLPSFDAAPSFGVLAPSLIWAMSESSMTLPFGLSFTGASPKVSSSSVESSPRSMYSLPWS